MNKSTYIAFLAKHVMLLYCIHVG